MKAGGFAALGVVAFASWTAVLVPLLKEAGRVAPLTVRATTASDFSPAGRLGIELLPLTPDAVKTLDGRPVNPELSLRPGLHALGYQLPRSPRRVEAVHLTKLIGPFAQDGWMSCAARVTVTQRMLNLRVAPLAGKLVAQAISAVDDLPRVKSVGTQLELTARGLAAQLDIHFVDQSELTVSSELAITSSGHAVVVKRIGAVTAHIKGPMVDEALDAYVPELVKKVPFALTILHKITGGTVRWVAQRMAKDKASDAVDLELVPTAMQLLRLPPQVALPGFPGSQLELRFCDHGLTTVASSHITAAFDLRVVTRARPGLPPGPVLVRGQPVAPPVGLPAGAELVVDVSIDGLNGLLDGLWRAGALDHALADPAVQTSLDEALDPLVFRARDLRAALPPVVSEVAPRAGGARVAVAGELALRLAPFGHEDRPGQDARLRVTSDLEVALGAAAPHPLTITAAPHSLGLTCRAPDPAMPGSLTLTACYADLVAMVGMSLDTPEVLALDSLRVPLDEILPRSTPDGQVRFTIERLGLTVVGRDWLRLDARADFAVR